MNQTLNHLNSRRAWLVPSVSVWGTIGAESLSAVATEVDDSQSRVVYADFTIGGMAQEIVFSSLVDHRGNNLPASIDAPVIVVVSKNEIPVAVIGMPSPTAFRIAKTVFDPGDAFVDLWIIEARS